MRSAFLDETGEFVWYTGQVGKPPLISIQSPTELYMYMYMYMYMLYISCTCCTCACV